MSYLFAWDNDVAETTVTQVADARTTLFNNLTDLVAQVNAARDAGAWSGSDEQMFREVFDNWRQAADAIFGVLDGTEKLVNGANDAIQKFRDEIMKSLS